MFNLNFLVMLRGMLKNGRKVTSPSPMPFLAVISPKVYDHNFGIAILSKIVEKLNKYVSKTQSRKEKKNEDNKKPVEKLKAMQIFWSRLPLDRPRCRIN